ncbi:MAG: hypothetical protein UV38_C0003G0105 [candidate division TM6 bacterium GW2011_GWE2_42_60]|nr:MAG: hypothetical protein UV38_C0003G0105 [candidate division TM6 bacterium GW2011_GWE2_42_60]HBY05415.1 hypothetical protein [Candidatus Dependentiae bacterium]
MIKKNKPISVQRATSTCEEFVDVLSPKKKLEFDEEYKNLVVSELILAVMEQDDISVRKLAKLAGVSPTIVQAMRSGAQKDFSMQSFFKILKGLGFKNLIVERNGHSYPLDISHLYKS